jgi:hypothetical protein
MSQDADRIKLVQVFIHFYYLENCNMLMTSCKFTLLSYQHLVVGS